MKFSEMSYQRPAPEETEKEALRLIEAFQKADSAEEAEKIFLEWDRFSQHIGTMMSLAYARHTINTEDPFYEQETEAMDEFSPVFSELQLRFTGQVLKSRFRKDLENRFGKLLFLNSDMFLRSFSSKIIPETQETNKLETAYQKLIASAQIEFEGEKRTISQMHPFKESPDDAVRMAAWEAEGRFYQENGDELDRIYDEMVTLRTKMAQKLGYKSFVPLGYLQMTRNCYTPEDVARFREAVRKYIVPIAERLFRDQAKRTGKPYPLSFSDAALKFVDGNPTPQGTAQDILRVGRELYHELSEETGSFIDLMFSDELMDVLSKKGKAGGGYCTSFDDYHVPFIFANFNGTADDVEVITHEAGHAFAYYMARDLLPSDFRSPTLEACEIHSMTMEFFGWAKSDAFFGSDSRKFRYSHLSGALTFLPYGTMVDHFQHIMYEQPDLTPAERHGVWRKLSAVYMPWIRLDGSPFYGEGRGWQRQMHIYENPFYYIDYCLAQTVALEFWVLIQQDHEKAWKQYMDLVRLAGTRTMTELVEAAGLHSPFEEETLQGVAEYADRWLTENSL